MSLLEHESVGNNARSEARFETAIGTVNFYLRLLHIVYRIAGIQAIVFRIHSQAVENLGSLVYNRGRRELCV